MVKIIIVFFARYVKESEAYRGQGIAGKLLDMVVEDMRGKGITPLYLITDHTGFYECYGWEYFCPAHEESAENTTRVYRHTWGSKFILPRTSHWS